MLKRTMRRRGDGFTLIEMLIVTTIMGFLAAVLMPNMVTAFRQRATSGSVDRLMIAHGLTRATAIRFGRVAELHIDAANKRFWVEVDTSGTGVRDTVGLVNQLDAALTVTSTRSLLCFDARGLATARGTENGLRRDPSKPWWVSWDTCPSVSLPLMAMSLVT